VLDGKATGGWAGIARLLPLFTLDGFRFMLAALLPGWAVLNVQSLTGLAGLRHRPAHGSQPGERGRQFHGPGAG
jgi:hypothetical protein